MQVKIESTYKAHHSLGKKGYGFSMGWTTRVWDPLVGLRAYFSIVKPTKRELRKIRKEFRNEYARLGNGVISY